MARHLVRHPRAVRFAANCAKAKAALWTAFVFVLVFVVTMAVSGIASGYIVAAVTGYVAPAVDAALLCMLLGGAVCFTLHGLCSLCVIG
jgi:hypothetical protein